MHGTVLVRQRLVVLLLQFLLQLLLVGGDLPLHLVVQPQRTLQIEHVLLAPVAGQVLRELLRRVLAALVSQPRQLLRVPLPARDCPHDVVFHFVS